MREYGLVAGNINVTYEGSVVAIHEIIVEEIGLYPSMLNVGEQQSMLFTDSCKGPFWLNNMDKILLRVMFIIKDPK